MKTIWIDRARFGVEADVLSGADLRYMPTPAIAPEVDLFAEKPWDDNDEIVEPQHRVQITDGMRFYTVPQNINAG